MRDDYKIQGAKSKIELEVEVRVIDSLKAMERFTQHTLSELANTALKRFIAQHNDFLPKERGSA